MTKASIFFDYVRQSGLVERQKLKRLAEAARHGKTIEQNSPNADAESQLISLQNVAGFEKLSSAEQFLTKEMVRLGWLNTWQISQLLEGRTRFTLDEYLIRDSLGLGGYAQVFLAESQKTSERVALKVFATSQSDPEVYERFSQEIELQKSFSHKNIVQLIKFGRDGNVDYMVFEYMAGGDVRRMIRNELQLPILQSVKIITQAAEGLAYLHQNGVVHRDVKPANILLTADGDAKVGDLGLCGYLNNEEKYDPRFGKLVGTADYMDPDHIRNPRQSSPLWDVYSLGCTFYQMVTGIVPFPKGESREKILAHLRSDVIDPRVFRNDLPHELAKVIAKMIAKEPQRRFQSAKEVVSALKPWYSAEKTSIASHIADIAKQPEHVAVDAETLRRLFDFSDQAIYAPSMFDLPKTDGLLETPQQNPPQRQTDSDEELNESLDLASVKSVPLEKERYAVSSSRDSFDTKNVEHRVLPVSLDSKTLSELAASLQKLEIPRWKRDFYACVRRSLPLRLRLSFAKREITMRRYCRQTRKENGREPSFLCRLWRLLTADAFDRRDYRRDLTSPRNQADNDNIEQASFGKNHNDNSTLEKIEFQLPIVLPGQSDTVTIVVPPVVVEIPGENSQLLAPPIQTIEKKKRKTKRSLRKFEPLSLLFGLYILTMIAMASMIVQILLGR
ncbi:MAG: serine/threonine protein kinase [Planctomycetaceae bacterium]|jgi:serine/threonine protein kinase|nr:serine/threonine protein kinase [Planctomycetaceae bacterium]